MNVKKTEKTKAKLLQAVRSIIALGDKPSVAAITKKANNVKVLYKLQTKITNAEINI